MRENRVLQVQSRKTLGLYAESLVHHSTLTSKTFGEIYTLDGKDLHAALGQSVHVSLLRWLATLLMIFSSPKVPSCRGAGPGGLPAELPRLSVHVACHKVDPPRAVQFAG